MDADTIIQNYKTHKTRSQKLDRSPKRDIFMRYLGLNEGAAEPNDQHRNTIELNLHTKGSFRSRFNEFEKKFNEGSWENNTNDYFSSFNKKAMTYKSPLSNRGDNTINRFKDIINGIQHIPTDTNPQNVLSEYSSTYKSKYLSPKPKNSTTADFVGSKFEIGTLVSQSNNSKPYTITKGKEPLRYETRRLQAHIDSLTENDYARLPASYRDDLAKLAQTILSHKRTSQFSFN